VTRLSNVPLVLLVAPNVAILSLNRATCRAPTSTQKCSNRVTSVAHFCHSERPEHCLCGIKPNPFWLRPNENGSLQRIMYCG
jgi:hypothetical protein